MFRCFSVSPSSIVPYIAAFAVGMGMLTVPSQNLPVLSVRKAELGIAASMNSVFRYVGSSLGAAVAGTILSSFEVAYPVTAFTFVAPTRAAFQYCFYSATVALAVVGVMAILAQEVAGRETADK
jgi:predicted MFS family arabinose efflux permease